MAQAMVQAWPDRQGIEEIVSQSEESVEDMLFWSIGFAKLLVGLIAQAEGTTSEATFEKLAAGMTRRAAGN